MTALNETIAPSTVVTTTHARYPIPGTDFTLVIDKRDSVSAFVSCGINSSTATVTAPTLARAVRDLRAHIKATDYPFLGIHRATVLVFLENAFTLKADKGE